MSHEELARYIIAQAAQGSLIYGKNITGQIYGPFAKHVRQNIMRALAGGKVPVSKCGANAVRQALIDRFGAEGDCIATRDDDLQQRIENAATSGIEVFARTTPEIAGFIDPSGALQRAGLEIVQRGE